MHNYLFVQYKPFDLDIFPDWGVRLFQGGGRLQLTQPHLQKKRDAQPSVYCFFLHSSGMVSPIHIITFDMICQFFYSH